MRLPGVYGPQDDSALLAEVVRREPVARGARTLELGTGTGVLALAAVRAGARHVTAVDASRRAVWTARVNAALAGAARRVRVVCGDLLAPLPAGPFDLVLANPPYVPEPDDLPVRRRDRRWDAGPDGRAALDHLCAAVPALLAPGGVLLLVHSELAGPDRTLACLAEAGLRTDVVARRLVPFGPVLRSRATWLAARGLVSPGQDEEELVVVRARRPGPERRR